MRGHNRSKIVAAQEPYRAYLETLRQRRQSASTVDCAAFACGHLEAFLVASATVLTDIATDDLDRFRQALAKQGLAAMSIDMILRHVRRLFRWLAETGQVFLDPAAGWSLPKRDRPMLAAPTVEQVATLLRQPDLSTPRGVRDRAFIETAYSTGARLEELTRLTIFDPDLDGGLVRVMGKGRKERMVPLGRQAVQWLRAYQRDARSKLAGNRLDEDRLWLGREGKPIDGSGLRMMLRVYSLAAGLPLISPHALRRACATHLLQNGAHPVQIQFLLGHADLASLSQYLRLTIRDIKAMHAKSKVGQ